jgi:hypothetical protein
MFLDTPANDIDKALGTVAADKPKRKDQMISLIGRVLFWIAVVVALLWGHGGFNDVFFKTEDSVTVSIVGMIAILLVGIALRYTFEALGRFWDR